MEIIDYTDSTFGFRDYGGSESKLTVKFNGKYYMLKRTDKEVKSHNDLQTSSPNNIFSEYIGSHIVASLGLDVHKTYLGKYKDDYVVACEDFCSDGYKHLEFANFMRAVYRTDEIGRFPTYKQINEIYDLSSELKPIKAESIERYWDMIIADALIGNFDRHKGNWGFLVNEELNDIKPAPIYDCGSCLYPRLSEDSMKKVLQSEDEINKRIYEFPSIALNKNDNPKKEEKFTYLELLSGEFYDKNCINSLKKLYKKISLDRINKIIDNAPLLSDTRKVFYKTMIKYRKEKVFDYAYSCIQTKNLD